MAVASTIPAKLSRPRLFDIAPRERLFAQLDAGRGHPAWWVEGPPGAGKTSLIAGYVEARNEPAWWYQVDDGDTDIANFFFYLRQLPGLPDTGDTLPLFAPEYQNDVPGFARRFFRTLYAALGRPALLVLDNVHEATANPAFSAVLREAISQIPEGVNLILASRWEPPAAFARLLAQRAVVRLGWSELRLTADEAGTIAGLERGPDDQRIAGLLAASGGWAAGLTLMLARHREDQSLPSDPEQPREATFAFLAAEILDAAPVATRDFLLSTWVLPRLTATIAGRLTGRPGAEDILAELFQRNYFVERHPGTEAAYQYHGLFREFLAAQAHRALGAEAIADLRYRGAALLEEAGDYAEAFALYEAAGAGVEGRRLVLTHGDSLARSGRLRTLAAWIAALPAELRSDSPGLAYWQGVCHLGNDPRQARQAFTEAADGFAAAGNEAASVKAIAGVIDTCYAEWSDFSALDPWITRIVALLDREVPFHRREDEAQAVAAALVALLYRQPAHPRLPALAARVHALLKDNLAANERVAAGTYLLNAYNWMGSTDLAREVIALVTPHLDAPEVAPLRRAWWSVRLAYHHYICGERAATASALTTAAAIAGEHNQPVTASIVLLYTAFHHLSAGEFAPAEAALAAFECGLDPGRHLDHAIASYQRAWIALGQGNLDAAREAGGWAVRLAEQAGVPNVRGYFQLLLAVVAGSRGEAATAAELWSAANGATDGDCFPLFAFTTGLVGAHLALRNGDEAGCRRHLVAALALGARHDYANNLLWLADTMARLCARALDWDIEAAYVRRLISRRGLLPPGPEAGHWPWPLRLFTLGAFRVERQGEALRFSGKAQKRPLALLMALVALGGREVGASRLAETLWPDADGDAARAALGTALYRLRHLLDCEDAILLNDGKLSLNPRCAWVDSQAFERLAERLRDNDGDLAAEQLFALYQGHFLEREDEQPWMLAPREKLKTLLGHTVEKIGLRLEEAGQWALAAQAYERGIALDMLAEPLYRRLMICQARQDRTAQAIETYRRCRQALSVVLGIAPAAETEALRRSLG